MILKSDENDSGLRLLLISRQNQNRKRCVLLVTNSICFFRMHTPVWRWRKSQYVCIQRHLRFILIGRIPWLLKVPIVIINYHYDTYKHDFVFLFDKLVCKIKLGKMWHVTLLGFHGLDLMMYFVCVLKSFTESFTVHTIFLNLLSFPFPSPLFVCL